MSEISLKLRPDRPATIGEHRALRDKVLHLRQALEWLLQNDELTNAGQKYVRETLATTQT
jgi:hypothetical protein